MNKLFFFSILGVVIWMAGGPPGLPPCTLSVTASANPLIVCEPGDVTTLQAITSEPVIGVSWTPTGGLSQPNSLVTQATVTATTTYEVTVQSLSGDNLIANGDFNSGFSNFTSDYVPGTGGTFGLLTNEGQYAVAANPSATHTNFASCTDHTGGGGMMVVNGAGVANQEILCQTVTVMPNTNYAIGAWVMSVVTGSPAQLQISVNGQLIGNLFNAPAATCTWSQFYETWNSGAAASVNVCIVNQNTALSGNDFAIDDLFLGEICEATDQVTVQLIEFDTDFDVPQDLCPFSLPFVLNTLLAPGSTPGGSWTVDGNSETLFDPGFYGPGPHQIVYTVTNGICTKSSTQTLIVEPLPVANWTTFDEICSNAAPILLNTLLAPNATQGGVWTVNGLPTTVFNPAAYPAGPHLINYRVGAFPCVVEHNNTVVITAAPATPQPVCAGGSSSSVLFQWSPVANAAGYQAIVASGQTGTLSGNTFLVNNLDPGETVSLQIVALGNAPCGNTTSALVSCTAPACPPAIIDVLAVDTICLDTISGPVSITAAASPPGGTLTWSGPGITDPGLNVFDPEIAGPGNHSVYVHYALDNCIYNDSLSIVVKADCSGCPDVQLQIIAPDVYCFLPDTSGFFNMQAIVTGGSGTGSGLWSGQGIINSSLGAFSPFTALAGYNRFTYTYQEGACTYTATDSIFVSKFPVPAFLMDNNVCLGDTALVNFLGNPNLPFHFLWDFDGGVVTSGMPPDDFGLTWTETDSHTVTLQLEQLGCVSKPFFQPIFIDTPIDTPTVVCDPTLTSVEFTWNQVPNGQAYIVYVIVGPNGEVTSDTSYRIPLLQPGETVQVELVTISGNSCPGNTTLQFCEALPCSPALIDLQLPPPRCVSAGEADTITLDYALFLDTALTYTLNWAGPGVIDPGQPRVRLTPDMAGQQNWITVTVDAGECIFSDSLLVEVLPPPTADLTLPAGLCQGDTAMVLYSVQAGNNVILDWNWDGGVVTDSSAAGYQVRWDQPGDYTVSLVALQDGCRSDTLFSSVQVAQSVDTVQISCETDFEEIRFHWPLASGATGYQINVLNGPAGQMMGDTAILFTGLPQGTSVTVEVVADGAAPCPDVRSELTCSTPICPAIEVSIEPLTAICFDGTPISLPLMAAIQGDTAGGVLQWSGTGVNGALWTVDAAQAGQATLIQAVFSNGICTYSDSIEVAVFNRPQVAFTAPDSLCTGQNAVWTFTGAAGSNASFHWTAGENQFSGPGPHPLSWADSGHYNLELWLEENGCLSDTLTGSVAVLAPFTTPQINCTPGLDRLTFSWSQTDAIPVTERIYIGAGTGVSLSDTSYQVTGLMPGEGGTLTVRWSDPALPCRDIEFSAGCEAETCPDIALSWQTAPLLCRGEMNEIVFHITGQQTPVDLLVTYQGQSQWLMGVSDGEIWNILLDSSAVILIDSIFNPSNPLCPVDVPAGLSIQVSQPVFAGIPNGQPAFCSSEDLVVDLAGLLDQTMPGGTWTEISAQPSTGNAFNPGAATFATGGQAPGLFIFRYTIAGEAPCPDDFAQVSIRIHSNPVADAGADIALGCDLSLASIGSSQTTAGMQYQWTGAAGVDPMDANIPVTEVAQADTYTLRVTDPLTGCTDSDEVTVTASTDFLDPFATVIPITCFQANDGYIRIDSIAGGHAPYSYSLNGGTFAGLALFGPLQPGLYTVNVRDDSGCEAQLSFNIGEPDQMDVKLITNLNSGENTINLGDTIQLIALVNRADDQIGSVVWKPDSLNYAPVELVREISPGESTFYTIAVTDINGCSDTYRLAVFVRKPRNVFIPNGFSPDNDGENDLFYIFGGKEILEVNRFMIFNRWGDLVYEQSHFQPNDPAHGWDGAYNGLPLNAGVYVYSAEIEFVDGEKVVYKGDVVLLRK